MHGAFHILWDAAQARSAAVPSRGELSPSRTWCVSTPTDPRIKGMPPVGLLRDCWARGLEYYESRRSHLVDHRLNTNGRPPNAPHIERLDSTPREIEDP